MDTKRREEGDWAVEEAGTGPDAEGGSFAGLIASQTPWWAISVAFHVLIIMLIGLVTWTVRDLSQEDLPIVEVTVRKPDIHKAEEVSGAQKKAADILELPYDVPATDPNSDKVFDVVVSPEMMALAEKGDHFETINLDRPDTHSASGNPDAKMFHKMHGDEGAAGGGGKYGKTLDELIGVGASNSPGTGGGWGGGDGTGEGIQKGPGTGSYGIRGGGGRKLMIMRYKGSAKTEGSVGKALKWLAAHQEQDGRWDSKKYGASGACDTAVTGLAVLAFLGAGYTETGGNKYRDNVQRGIYWLISKQNNDGLVLADGEGPAGYNHAIAGLALAEAAGMARVPETVRAAQKAVDYSVNIHQDPGAGGSDKKGWRYTAKQPGDVSVTGWFVMQLKSARMSKLKVDDSAFRGAVNFLDSVEIEKANASDPYSGHRYGYQPGRVLSRHRNTAIGVLCRQFLGWKPHEIQGGVEYFLKEGGVPNWGEADFYYWYYAAMVCFQYDAPKGDVWTRWNEAMKPTLCDNQRVGGDEDGSWDPVGAFGDRAGRVFTTAVGALCLEVYYRYLPMYK